MVTCSTPHQLVTINHGNVHDSICMHARNPELPLGTGAPFVLDEEWGNWQQVFLQTCRPLFLAQVVVSTNQQHGLEAAVQNQVHIKCVFLVSYRITLFSTASLRLA